MTRRKKTPGRDGSGPVESSDKAQRSESEAPPSLSDPRSMDFHPASESPDALAADAPVDSGVTREVESVRARRGKRGRGKAAEAEREPDTVVERGPPAEVAEVTETGSAGDADELATTREVESVRARRTRSRRPADFDSVTTQSAVPAELLEEAMGEAPSVEGRRVAEMARAAEVARQNAEVDPLADPEMTVNLSGDVLAGLDANASPADAEGDHAAESSSPPTEAEAEAEPEPEPEPELDEAAHLRGLVEALVFASDMPIKLHDIAKFAMASQKQIKDALVDLQGEYARRGIHLEEVAGGWVFRTSARYAPFIRDLTKQKPVRLTRAQVETLAIIAYRQPMTRPEIDDVRGVDSGPVLKVLLERDLVRILGKRDEVGRPLIYGTTNHFLEFFGLKSLKDLPTLREFTELTDESRVTYELEIGESPNDLSVPPVIEGEQEDGERVVRQSMAVPSGSDEIEGDFEAVSIRMDDDGSELDDARSADDDA